jgi:uncharacterized RDD family membrane protein YckC
MDSDTAGPTPVETNREVVGERVGAAIIDLLVLGALFVVMAVLFGGAQSTTATGLNDPAVHTSGTSVSLTGLPFVVFLALTLVYYFALELRYGQTIGKRVVSIRVVSLDGGRPTPSAILIRTIGRVVDVLPVFYLLGFLVLVSGRSRQRIGDRLARTTVVRS